LRIADDEFVVLFCGRLDAMKQPLLALHIFTAFLRRNPRARFLIVGDGPDGSSLKTEIRRLGVDARVLAVGRVSDPVPYYAAADCFLSTSLNMEGCPLAPSEAMAMGLPAVVPDDDIFAAVYGGCSTVRRCDPLNTQQYVEALCECSCVTNEMREDARRFVLSTLSATSMTEQLKAFYSRTLPTSRDVHLTAPDATTR
jgi:glycosyltransferase involved in cell wall biosynthesis